MAAEVAQRHSAARSLTGRGQAWPLPAAAPPGPQLRRRGPAVQTWSVPCRRLASAASSRERNGPLASLAFAGCVTTHAGAASADSCSGGMEGAGPSVLWSAISVCAAPSRCPAHGPQHPTAVKGTRGRRGHPDGGGHPPSLQSTFSAGLSVSVTMRQDAGLQVILHPTQRRHGTVESARTCQSGPVTQRGSPTGVHRSVTSF